MRRRKRRPSSRSSRRRPRKRCPTSTQKWTRFEKRSALPAHTQHAPSVSEISHARYFALPLVCVDRSVPVLTQPLESVSAAHRKGEKGEEGKKTLSGPYPKVYCCLLELALIRLLVRELMFTRSNQRVRNTLRPHATFAKSRCLIVFPAVLS